MIWSKSKKQFESFLSPQLQGRVSIHVTAYTRTNVLNVGRGWITLDGTEVVSVGIPSFFSENFTFRIETMDFGEAVRAYLSMSIEESLTSSDELIAGFAYLDRRLGQRTLAKVERDLLHPFAQELYDIRVSAGPVA